MNKKMKKLEQETNTWKGKYENCAKSLASIAENVYKFFFLRFNQFVILII